MNNAPEWVELFVELITDYVVWQSRPTGIVTDDEAKWLIERADGCRSVEALAVLVNVLAEAHRAPQWFVVGGARPGLPMARRRGRAEGEGELTARARRRPICSGFEGFQGDTPDLRAAVTASRRPARASSATPDVTAHSDRLSNVFMALRPRPGLPSGEGASVFRGLRTMRRFAASSGPRSAAPDAGLNNRGRSICEGLGVRAYAREAGGLAGEGAFASRNVRRFETGGRRL